MSKKSPSLAEELPYWEFFSGVPDHAVLVDGSLVAGIEVKPRDIEALDEASVNQFTEILRSAINSVSEGTTLQFVFSVQSDFKDMLSMHRDRKTETLHPIIRKIAEDREETLFSEMESGLLYRPNLKVFLRVPAECLKKSSFFKKAELFSKVAVETHAETLELLEQNINSLSAAFASAGLKNKTLTRKEILEVVYTTLNPTRSRTEPLPEVRTPKESDPPQELLEELPWLANCSPRQQLIFGDLIKDYDQFTLDKKYHRVVTLKTLPEATFAGQLGNFLRLPFHYDLIVTVEIPAQAGEMAKLQQKRKMAHSLAVTQAGRASDLESETKLSSTEELIRELLTTGQRIYAVQLAIILRADASPTGNKELNRRVRDILAGFRSLQGAEGLEEGVGSWKIFKGSLPAAPLNIERAKKMKTNNLVDFLPVYAPREGDIDPVVILRNRMGGLVSYDGFNPGLTNYNTLVTGSSGAGKSFINNCILLQELARGLRVFIIDIGGSYKKLTETLNGQYLEIGLANGNKINPFDIPDPRSAPNNQKIKSLMAVVEAMVGENEQSKLTKLDRTLLEKSILDLYSIKRETADVPTLTDLSKYLAAQDEPSLKTMAKLLYVWTGDRPYGQLLDGQGTLRTDASICTFDLKGLSNHPDLQSVMILILTDFILSQVEHDRTSRKRIILDEAWELLKSQSAANFMEYCARTLRKTGSGITFITQAVADIESSPIGTAILNNTATKLVMLQRGATDALSRTLKLNSQELALIHSLTQKKGEYSEGFLIEGDERQVIRVSPSPLEYWLSTSDAEDNAYLEKERKNGLTLTEAIEKAAHQIPTGIAAHREAGQ